MQHIFKFSNIRRKPTRQGSSSPNNTSPRQVPCWELQDLITWKKWMEDERMSATLRRNLLRKVNYLYNKEDDTDKWFFSFYKFSLPLKSTLSKQTQLMISRRWILRSRSRWPCSLNHRSQAALMLESRVRNPLKVWIFVPCVCCVGSGFCDELTT